MAMKLESAKAPQKKRSPFCSKVMALAKGSLSKEEAGRLESVIIEAEERDEIIAQGIATVLDLAGLPPDDLDELASMLKKAYENVSLGREPFTREALSRLDSILRDKVSAKALARMEADLSKPNDVVLRAVKEMLESRSERSQKMKTTPKRK